MFRPTSAQVSLLESRYLLPPSKQARLEHSWAHVVNVRILRLIDESLLQDSFDPVNGRPNCSIRLLVGVHLLKAWNDLTDEQALEQLEFNLQWHYALGITAEEAHLPQKTLHNFRVRLMANERALAMFNRLTKSLVEMDGLSVVRQRLDSTHVISDIALLTRLGLFVETVTNFLREIKTEQQGMLEWVETEVRHRYLEREGYFSDANREQAPRRLPIAARDLLFLVRRFEKMEVITAWESYRLMVRLLAEQCDITVEEGGDTENGNQEKIALKEPKQVTGASLQSPHDPDATYGHKGKGYEAQLAETCVEENPYQVLTHVEVNGANESDQNATVPIVEKLADKGLRPEVLIADTGFGSGENIVACAVEGVYLLAPVQDPEAPKKLDFRWEPTVVEDRTRAPVVVGGSVEDGSELPSSEAAPTHEVVEPQPTPASEEHCDEGPKTAPESSKAVPLDLGAFRFNSTFCEVESCPAGHAPMRQEVLEGNVPFKAMFSGEHCEGCPFADRCPTRKIAGTKDRVLKWRDSQAATATRQREQQEPAFKAAYKIRSGIESANEEIKGRHGAGNLRVRGKRRVALDITLKAMAMNVKRAVQHHVDRLREALKSLPGELAEVG